MAQENKSIEVNTEEAVQVAEKVEVEKGGYADFAIQPDFDSVFRGYTQPVTPQAQPTISVKTTSQQEEMLNAVYWQSKKAMNDTLVRMAYAVQHIMDSVLDVAAKSQSFYKQHTLQPESAPPVQQYPMPMPQRKPAPFVQSYPGSALPERVRMSLQEAYQYKFGNVIVFPLKDGTWTMGMPDGTALTLFDDGIWRTR